ncbi:MAG: amidohydrolase [Sphaerochaetaceae bacterium]|nr:amidohydrolase [Sphaerochaetaceae bacterium]
MKLLIKNALVIKMDSEASTAIEDIGIVNSRIKYLGKSSSFKDEFDEIIDARNMIALPAFVDAHTHLSMGYMRNYKDTSPDLFSWLNEIFPIEAKLNDDDIYWGSLLGCAELIKGGCTTFADMYFNRDQTAKAVLEAGINANIGFTLFGDLADSKRRYKEEYPKIKPFVDHDRIILDVAPHAIYTTTGESYVYGADFAKDIGGKLHTHLSETSKEVKDSIQSFNMTPATYLNSLGIFDKVGTYLAHCVHLTEEEINLIKGKDVSIVHNPSSNCKLASGIAPMKSYKNNGINLALGTDGASSNNNLNMMKELNLAALLASVSEMDTIAFKPFEILQMATLGGAKALGREKDLGTIEIGKKADIILINKNSLNMTPMNNVYSALVYSCSSENINTVISNGKILMKDRKLLTMDEKEICQKVNKIWLDIRER